MQQPPWENTRDRVHLSGPDTAGPNATISQPSTSLCALTRSARQSPQCKQIGIRAESSNRAGGNTRDDRRVPELLTRRRVGQMDLDQLRPAGGDQGTSVADGIGVMRECGRVEHDIGTAVDRLLDPADKLCLVVRLAEVHN